MSTQNVIKDINTRPETVQLLAGNIRKILPNMDVDNNFLDATIKTKAKIDKWGCIIKSFYMAKE